MSSIARRDLPRLDLLRSFEAAARLSSFTHAADELALTQSAVSRQIQALEEGLGVPLFERRHRAIELTEAGRTLHRAVTDCLLRLRDVTLQLRQSTTARQVSVTTTPGFASLWLIPRLARFTASHPAVDVRISATLELQDLDRSDLDVAVRFMPIARGQGQPLFEESVVPVCAPQLARATQAPLKKPQDLAHHTMLTVDSHERGALAADWAPWLEVMNLSELRMRRVLRFSQYSDAINAAVGGQGVAIGRLPLLADLLREGRLVTPFRGSAASQRGYFIETSTRAADNNIDATEFVRWLLDEGRAAVRDSSS